MAANQDRSRLEVLRRREYPTTGSGVISMGDMVIGDGSGNATKATGTDDAVADAFLGIAIHAKPATSAPKIVVGADVVAEMDVAGSGLAVAAKVGDAVEYDSTNTDAQTVKLGTTNPIGKVYRAAAIGETTLMVHFVGRDIRGPVVAD